MGICSSSRSKTIEQATLYREKSTLTRDEVSQGGLRAGGTLGGNSSSYTAQRIAEEEASLRRVVEQTSHQLIDMSHGIPHQDALATEQRLRRYQQATEVRLALRTGGAEVRHGGLPRGSGGGGWGEKAAPRWAGLEGAAATVRGAAEGMKVAEPGESLIAAFGSTLQ